MEFGVGTKHNAFKSILVDDGNFNYNEHVRVETSQKSCRNFWITPQGGTSNQNGPFIFSIGPLTDQYLVLNRAALETTISIRNEDGSELDTVEDVVAMCNGMATSLFDETHVVFNGHHFPGSCSINTHYKAMVETLMSYDQDARATHLMAQGFHLDTPNEGDNMDLDERTMIKMIYQQIKDGKLTPPIYPVELKIDGEEGFVPPADIAEWSPNQKEHFGRLLFKKRFEYLEKHCKELLRNDINANRLTSNERVNSGFVARYRLAAGSKRINLIGPLCHDFFNMSNHVGPLNQIEIRLNRAKNSFLLNTYLPKRYKVVIHDMKLHLHTIERKERINIPEIERYRFNQTEMHKHVIAKGVTNHTAKIHIGGVMPKTIILGFVYTKAAEGAYNFNPYNFHHFNIRNVTLMVSGEAYPATGLHFDFEPRNSQVARAYRWVYENTGALTGGRGNLISYPGFEVGYFLIPYDMTPDMCNGLHNHEGVHGTIDVQLTFAKPLDDSVTMLSELVFNKMLVNEKLNNRVEIIDIK